MDAGLITAIAGAIVGIGGLIFGIVKWVQEINTKKEAEKKRVEDQIILEGVSKMIQPIKQQNEEQNKAIEDLRKQFVEETQNLKNLSDNNELDRLRAEIMQFVCYLKNGMHMDSAEFKHIHKAYDKYHNMGGNSYIDEDFKYILEKEREYNLTGR